MDRQDILDLISDALGDSMDMDWNYAVGARYILAALERHGLIRQDVGPSPKDIWMIGRLPGDDGLVIRDGNGLFICRCLGEPTAEQVVGLHNEAELMRAVDGMEALTALRASLEGMERTINGTPGDDYNELHDHVQDALRAAGLLPST